MNQHRFSVTKNRYLKPSILQLSEGLVLELFEL